jgi:hypothetical protein
VRAERRGGAHPCAVFSAAERVPGSRDLSVKRNCTICASRRYHLRGRQEFAHRQPA